jgi:bifunctional non-homologous end joining protein LigD
LAKKLSAYRRKRDPAQTNEPFGAEPLHSSGTAADPSVPTSWMGAFVCHLHDATRLHYDLRLEVGGVLQSFAVPRGPSLDPKEKRLAVHTENHPIEYLDFEAVIPPGNYGAGAMIAWDRGSVRFLPPEPEEGLKTGKLDFILSGYKLRGRYTLVKVSGRKGQPEPEQTEWLLIKKTDPYAREGSSIIDEQPRSVLSGLTITELPDAQRIAAEIEAEARATGGTKLKDDPSGWIPMLCGHGEEAALARPGFVYELKLDGARALAVRDGDQVTLRYRSGRNTTESFPEIARALRALPNHDFVIDGEIVAFDERGRPDFQRLSPRFHATRAQEARRAAREIPVNYVAFDLLALGGRDLRGLPLRERKGLLSRVLQGKGLVRTLDHLDDDARPLWALCKQHGLEGVIAKRGDSKYQVGPRRGSDWLKIKLDRADDFVVVGWTRGEGARDALGALDIASYVGDVLMYRGRVGSGLDDATIDLLRARLAPLSVDSAPAKGELMPAPRGRTFVRPEIVVSVHHAGFTREGHLRHPVFRGVRDDVAADACRAAPDEERVEAALAEADRTHHARSPGAVGRAKLSNQDKVFWPDEGYTKGELCRYYERISDTILTYLRGRPVLMVRYPDGITGKSFFQWNAPSHTPDWVRLFPLRSEEKDERDVTAFLVDDVDTLLFIANLGCIPLHVLASHADDLEVSDFLTIDFDIGSAPFVHAVELARSLHDILEQIGLRGFPKTSGQTGLHVLVALGGAPFLVAKTLAELLGRILQKKHPKISTMERVRSKRPANTVYIDTGQTGRSRAIVAPYSVRATPGARVSTPLTWDEVGYGLDPSVFTMFTVPERVALHGDPMAELLDEHPDILAAVNTLAKLM